jgi:Mg-chelatase subunit ChlD
MKKTMVLLIFMLCQHTFIHAVEKSDFDIELVNKSNSLLKSTDVPFQGTSLSNDVMEVTLIEGAYFTIGTTNGTSDSDLDDKCGITFGHPFALTSHPILSIDSQRGKPEDFFYTNGINSSIQDNSIFVEYTKNELYKFTFQLAQNTGDVTISSSIENLDTSPHTFGLGLMLDPGIGKKGDGFVEFQKEKFLYETLLTDESIPENLIITERSGHVDGMKISVDFTGNIPDNLSLANWKNIFQNFREDQVISTMEKLYDLTIKMLWDEQEIAAGSSLTRSLTIQIENPEFNSTSFIRWDIPSFFSIENNMLFPRSFNSYAEISNLSSGNLDNCLLNLNVPDELSISASSYSLNITYGGVYFQPITLKSKEIYEDRIVDLSLQLWHNEQLLDSLKRSVFIPATPFSDTGLVCTIDTVMTDNYPEVKITFTPTIEKTGQYLLHLAKENIFLYENQNRINLFDIGKDTTGGSGQADIVFVLDISTSMSNEINGVKNNIVEFVDSLNYRHVDFQLGMVTFIDEVINTYEFSKDHIQFQNTVNNLGVLNNGNVTWPENSLDALYQASQLQFRQKANRVFIWITDADYHERNNFTDYSRNDIINILLLNNITVHSIGAAEFQTEWYNSIIEPTGGNFYDINGNFRDILLDISRMRGLSKYMITYNSPHTSPGVNNITLEIHYAGLGGFGYIEYGKPTTSNQVLKSLKCFPNPFNPTTQIKVELNEIMTGNVDIFNILGRRVRSFPLKDFNTNHVFQWDARDMFNQQVAAGTYFVRLNLVRADKTISKTEMIKILCLK